MTDVIVEEAECTRLLEKLDGLPLAVAQAGAFLKESGLSVQSYLRLYEEQWNELAQSLHESEAALDDYPDRSVWTTWNISFDSIVTMDPHVANLLLLWSYLDNRDLWYGIFEEIVNCASIAQRLSKWIGDIASNEIVFSKAMQLLRSFSLIEAVQSTNSYTTHPVVHRWAYFAKGRQYEVELGCLAVAVVGLAVPMQSYSMYASGQRRLLSHAQACSDRICKLDLKKLEKADIQVKRSILRAIHNIAMLYCDQRKPNDAEKMYLRALESYKEEYGADHESTLRVANNLGLLYDHQSKFNEAETIYLGVLEITERTFGAKHISTLNILSSLGLLYTHQGRFNEAEKWHMRALEGREGTLGANHLLTLQTLHNIGVLYMRQGKLNEAENVLARALEGFKASLDYNNFKTRPLILDTMWHLGTLWTKDRPENAKEMFEMALYGYRINEGNLSKNCINLERNLNELKHSMQSRQDVKQPDRDRPSKSGQKKS